MADDMSAVKKFTVDLLLYFIKSLIFIYDLLSQPVFYFKHQVYKKQHEIEYVERSRQMDSFNPNSPWCQINIDPRQKQIENKIDSYTTYDEMMRDSFRASADSPCYAVRQTLHEQWVKKPGSDKLLRQVKLSDYKWVSFRQFEHQIESARRGFLLEGIRAGDKVMLYADTRPEWQISSQALIRLGAVVGTMYSTLGVDGIIHSVNETKVSHIVTQRDKVNKLLRLKSKLPLLRKIIYFDPLLKLPASAGDEQAQQAEANNHSASAESESLEKVAGDQKTDFDPQDPTEANYIHCVSLSEVMARGSSPADNNNSEDEKVLAKLEDEARQVLARRDKDSIAVIMYTSGSTGIPKGVLISHRNIMATIKSFSYVTKDFIHAPKNNVCTAYLPLAHIFEFCIESMMLYHGVRFGFATPHTLTDKSPGLVPGETGDLNILQPTVMIIVPLILDRIVQGVKQALKAQSYFKEQLVSYLIEYKSYWQKRHYETPLVDKLVCSKIAAALGGRARYVICGSAPLSGKTQTFVRAALNLKLPQGFGTTETCAATACQLFEDQSTENVGLPVSGALIRLEPWLEGNYRPTDKPHARGEIVVGGEMIAHGYFNLDEQTKEAFFVDDEGRRWYRTGDIGEFLPNGNLKIIDRKKDLVKLQNGEYISLGKVESSLKSNPFTDNFCVYANSNHNYVVALGPANELAIKTLAQQIIENHERNSQASDDSRTSLLANGYSQADKEKLIDELKSILDSYESSSGADDESSTMKHYSSADPAGIESANNNNLQRSTEKTNDRLKRLCENTLINQHIHDHILKMAKERNLMSLEVPRKILLVPREWTEDDNLVTAALKIRRNYIYKRYERELAEMYETNNNER